ncbi:MAG: lysostaphin resistance A-like protein [Patescibacteria group bacterium]
MKKIVGFFRMVGVVLLYVALYYLIFRTVLYVWDKILPDIGPLRGLVKNNPLGIVVFNDLIALPLFYLVTLGVNRRNMFQTSKLKAIRPWHAVLSIMAGLSMGLFVAGVFKLPYFDRVKSLHDIIYFIYNSSSLYAFFLFVTIGTLFKEILFRGLIFNEFHRVMPFWLANLLQAVMYGILFMNLEPFMTLFGVLGSLVVGLVYLYTDSLFGCIIAQITNNLCILAFRRVWGDVLQGTGLGVPFALGLFSLVLLLGTWYFLRRSGRKK